MQLLQFNIIFPSAINFSNSRFVTGVDIRQVKIAIKIACTRCIGGGKIVSNFVLP